MDFKLKIVVKELLCIGAALLTVMRCNAGGTNDSPENVTTTKTLRPRFEWSAPPETDVVYDLVVCEGLSESHGYWIPGKTVQHREGITTTKFKLEKPLSADTVYVWSVRARSGKGTSKWAEYMDGDWSRLQTESRRHNILCAFKTPGR